MSKVKELEDPHLFYLNPARFPGLNEENAVMAQTLLRLPVGALDTTKQLGRLDPNEIKKS